MKKTIILTICLFLFSLPVYTQDFQFTIEFEDAIGNKDSLIFGTDELGTIRIDTVLGEENIIDLPLDEEFDVRVTDELISRRFEDSVSSFHTKMQFIKQDWLVNSAFIEIDVKCSNYPIIVRWDSTLFNEQEFRRTFISAQRPGNWDAGGKFNPDFVPLNSADTVKFISKINPVDMIENIYAYVNDENDTIAVFWFAFANEDFTTNVNLPLDKELLKIYPNPTSNYVEIQSDPALRIKTIKLRDFMGKRVSISAYSPKDKLDLSGLLPGYYWLEISLDNGKQIIRPIIKT